MRSGIVMRKEPPDMIYGIWNVRKSYQFSLSGSINFSYRDKVYYSPGKEYVMTYTTAYIQQRVRDLRSFKPDIPPSELESAIMAAIGFTAVKLKFNSFATGWSKSHPDAAARGELDSLLDTDDMINLYYKMISWSKVEPTGQYTSVRDENDFIPIPKTRDVHRYLSVIRQKEQKDPA